MSQTMIGPDGQEHEFPDGTPLQVMQTAVRKHGDDQADVAQTKAEGDSGVLGSIERNAGAGLAGWAKGFTSDPLSALLHPIDTARTIGTAASEAVHHPNEILPAMLQGAADPDTFGRAMGGAAQGVALAAAPSAISGLAEAASGTRPMAALGRGMAKVAPYTPKVLGTDISPALKGLGDLLSEEPAAGRPRVALPKEIGAPSEPGMAVARKPIARPQPAPLPEPVSSGPTAPPEINMGAQPEVQSLSGEKLPVAANRTVPPLVKGDFLEGHMADSLKGLMDESASPDPDSTFVDRRTGITKRYGDTTQGMSDADYERELAKPSRLGPDTTDDQVANAIGTLKAQPVPYQQGLPPSLAGLQSTAEETAATPLPESWQPYAVNDETAPGWVADRAAEEEARLGDNARRQAQRAGSR